MFGVIAQLQGSRRKETIVLRESVSRKLRREAVGKPTSSAPTVVDTDNQRVCSPRTEASIWLLQKQRARGCRPSGKLGLAG
jgi:hypothetical protein